MKTILVVDDEADIALTLKAFIELHGFRVLTAFDGLEGLHKALDEPPDLVVTDITMPRMDGLELVNRMRASAALRMVPIIVISAHDHKSEMPFLRKPFDPKVLLAKIRELLNE